MLLVGRATLCDSPYLAALSAAGGAVAVAAARVASVGAAIGCRSEDGLVDAAAAVCCPPPAFVRAVSCSPLIRPLSSPTGGSVAASIRRL